MPKGRQSNPSTDKIGNWVSVYKIYTYTITLNKLNVVYWKYSAFCILFYIGLDSSTIKPS